MGPAPVRKDLVGISAATILCGLLLALLLVVPRAGATDAAGLESKLAAARGEASSIAASLRESQARYLAAQGEAASAAAREQKLSGLLAEGQQRAAELSRKVTRTRRHLAAEKARLRRSRRALARRLVAIYESGLPSTASLVLGSGDYDDLATSADYMREIAQSDSALAERVEQVRNAVHRQVLLVAALKARAVAYDERLAAARSQISTVRRAAEEAAARLHSISASRAASLASLKSDIGAWVKQIQAARAASEAEAEAEVGRWLGGPYSIPAYIVLCESGGDYGALNPSSGAGGAYQILPSTWELYGGQGAPQDASKAEQDQIAAEIWADSGPGAWVCG